MNSELPQPGCFTRSKVSQPVLRSVDSIGESYSPVWINDGELEGVLRELEQQGPNTVELLQRTATQLSLNADAHKSFIAFGGVQTLEALLACDNPNIQLRALAVMEVLAENTRNAVSLLQTGVLSLLVHILTSPRYNGRRKAITADVIKFLGGGQVVYEKPQNQDLMECNLLGLSEAEASSLTPSQPKQYTMPVWCYSVDPILAWDSEAIVHLVDILFQGGAGELESVLSHALTRVTLVRSMGGPLVVEPPVMEALTALIYAMHPSLRSILHAVVALCVLHPLNEALFVRLGGVQALAFVGSCDTGGGAMGELSAWVLAFLASRSTEAAKRIGASEAVEVLVEMLYSEEVRTRQAATRAVCCLASSDRGKLAPVRRRLVRCNAVPGLLSVLQSAEQDLGVQRPLVMDVIRTFWKMRKVKECRQEMRGAGVVEALRQISHCPDSEVSLLAMQCNLALNPSRRTFGPVLRSVQCLGNPKLGERSGPALPGGGDAVSTYGKTGAAVLESSKVPLNRQRGAVFSKIRVKIRKIFIRLKLKSSTATKSRLSDRPAGDHEGSAAPEHAPQLELRNNSVQSAGQPQAQQYPPNQILDAPISKPASASAHTSPTPTPTTTPPRSRAPSFDGEIDFLRRSGSASSLQRAGSRGSLGSKSSDLKLGGYQVSSVLANGGGVVPGPMSDDLRREGEDPNSADAKKIKWFVKRQGVGYTKI